MTTLVWTDALRVNQPLMDRTHEEFVELLADVHRAKAEGDLARVLSAFERLLEHTVEHFGQEDRWMRATGFSPDNCHARQHTMVLDMMHEVLRLAREEGRREPLAFLLGELAQWFPAHAQMMDAGLAFHMAQVGFDPLTGEVAGSLPDTELTHCGSAGCR
jgi:hemerythrin-like metal-binding protein